MKFIYKLKAVTIKYCIVYNNQEGNWDGEKFVYNRYYENVCKKCAIKYTFRYTCSITRLISKQHFEKNFDSLHKRCKECDALLYTLKSIKTKTNYVYH